MADNFVLVQDSRNLRMTFCSDYLLGATDYHETLGFIVAIYTITITRVFIIRIKSLNEIIGMTAELPVAHLPQNHYAA